MEFSVLGYITVTITGMLAICYLFQDKRSCIENEFDFRTYLNLIVGVVVLLIEERKRKEGP